MSDPQQPPLPERQPRARSTVAWRDWRDWQRMADGIAFAARETLRMRSNAKPPRWWEPGGELVLKPGEESVSFASGKYNPPGPADYLVRNADFSARKLKAAPSRGKKTLPAGWDKDLRSDEENAEKFQRRVAFSLDTPIEDEAGEGESIGEYAFFGDSTLADYFVHAKKPRRELRTGWLEMTLDQALGLRQIQDPGQLIEAWEEIAKNPPTGDEPTHWLPSPELVRATCAIGTDPWILGTLAVLSHLHKRLLEPESTGLRAASADSSAPPLEGSPRVRRHRARYYVDGDELLAACRFRAQQRGDRIPTWADNPKLMLLLLGVIGGTAGGGDYQLAEVTVAKLLASRKRMAKWIRGLARDLEEKLEWNDGHVRELTHVAHWIDGSATPATPRGEEADHIHHQKLTAAQREERATRRYGTRARELAEFVRWKFRAGPEPDFSVPDLRELGDTTAARIAALKSGEPESLVCLPDRDCVIAEQAKPVYIEPSLRLSGEGFLFWYPQGADRSTEFAAGMPTPQYARNLYGALKFGNQIIYFESDNNGLRRDTQSGVPQISRGNTGDECLAAPTHPAHAQGSLYFLGPQQSESQNHAGHNNQDRNVAAASQPTEG